LKPSPYFADQFKFFFKRFASKQKLTRWFLEQAGEESGAFNFPAVLREKPKTLVFLPRDVESASTFMHSMPQAWFQDAFICAHESLHTLISAKRAKSVCYSDTECRFGEIVFQEMEQKIIEYGPTVCIYLGEPFLPRLYLAKKSGAGCRIGFNCESEFPFLNLSLRPENSSPAALLTNYYGY
jgi:hypothetical protein